MTASTDLRLRWPTSTSRWLLAAGIAGSALAVGTVHTITLCIVTSVLAAAAALAWWGVAPTRVRAPATVLFWTGAGLTAYTALQCVPLPMAWLAAVAPHTADVWSRALTPLHEPGPAWAPLSLDPTATRVEVLKGIAYLLALVAAVRIARRRDGVTFLSAVIVVTTLALVLAAVLHPAFGARALFGLFEPGPGIPDRHVAPLMNPNNLAAYVNVGLCLVLAEALSPEPKVPRVLAGAIALALVGGQVWIASRGGMISMVLGIALVVALARAGRSRTALKTRALYLASGLAALAGVAMIAFSAEGVRGELFDANVSKLELFAQAMRMVRAYPVFGAGRGSFESTFPAFRGAFAHMHASVWHVTFAYPENVLAQWTTEWGVPVSVAGFAAIGWALRPVAAVARSTSAAGAWAALVTVAVHNFGDLSSEVPGVVLALVASAAIVVGGTVGEKQTWTLERWSSAPRTVAAISLVASALGLAACLPGLGRDLSEDNAELYRAALEKLPLTELEGMARTAMLRHPSEPYLPFIVGVRASQEGSPVAIAWLGATLERARMYGPAHLALARLLASRSPAQARLECRYALEQAPELFKVVISDCPRLVGSRWDALEIVPSEPALAVRTLDALAQSVAERLPATRVELDAEIEARAPASLGRLQRAATDAVDDLRAGDAAPWCIGDARDRCTERAQDLAQRLTGLTPGECTGYELHARALVASGATRAGLAALDRATDIVEDRVPCLIQLVDVAADANDPAMVESALDRIVRAGCRDPRECVKNLVFVAQREEAHGEERRALALYKRAYDQSPDDDEVLAEMARLAATTGRHAEAQDDYRKLAKKHPEAKEWADAADREHEAALRELL